MRRDWFVIYDILDSCANGNMDWYEYKPGRWYSKEEFEYNFSLIMDEKLTQGDRLTWRGNDILDDLELKMYYYRKSKEQQGKENE